MKRLIIIVFGILLSLVFFISTKQLNKHNSIDYLNSLAINAKMHVLEQDKIFYLSNSDEMELLFKTQFAFAPHQIVKTNIKEINNNEFILLVIDKALNTNAVLNNIKITDSDTIFLEENHFYKLIILKK